MPDQPGPAVPVPPAPSAPSGGAAPDLAQSLYERNAELGIKNKTLSLLGKLYELGIEALKPQDLAARLSQAVQEDLVCEFAGIYLYDVDGNELRPLGLATSTRFQAALAENGVILESISIPVLHSSVLQSCVLEHAMATTEHLDEVWGSLIPQKLYDRVAADGHIRSVLAFPLASGHKSLGAMILCLNREYAQLLEFERQLVTSSVNVVAVAVDKARAYEALEAANTQLTELSHFKTQLLSLASHQIKAPLAAMKGYLALMLEGGYGAVSENLLKPLQSMQHSADGLVDLVTSLLDLRKIEEGKMEYAFARVDLAAIARDVVEELTLLATEKKLALTADGLAQQAWVKADATKLKQVVQNLVDNAIKYTPAGTVAVKLAVTDRLASVSVTDSGLGIAPALLPRLFEEFTRDQRVQHTIRGTGLGLYIAKRIVEAHGGTIIADSAGEGQGSTFTVTLPLDQAAA